MWYQASTVCLCLLQPPVTGGGYAFGSCHYQLSTPAATAAFAGLTIICPEYRLAPEHPFPAGLNDVVAVYKALITQEGYKPQNIVLLGDSAGGGMIAAVAIQLKRQGVALPAALGMFSPWTDMRNRGDSAKTLIAVDPFVVCQGDNPMAELQGVYLGNDASLLDNPLASPVEADYVALFPGGSLPPALIQVGMRELMLSDSVRLYHKMKAASPMRGHVVLSPYEGMWHVFQAFADLPEAEVASREMADHFTQALEGGTHESPTSREAPSRLL